MRTPMALMAAVLALAFQGAFAQTTAPAEGQSAGVVSEQDRAHKFEKAADYYAECRGVGEGDFEKIKEQLRAFTDAEIMARTMADPVKFAELMRVVNDPRTMHVMMSCATEPVMWDTWMRGLTDWQKMTRAGMVFMNPAMYMNWAMAPMNPQVWQPMMAFMDPGYYLRWMNAAMNPAFYQPFFSMANPAWYTPRMAWMMNPQSYQPMMTMVTPPAVPAVPPQEAPAK